MIDKKYLSERDFSYRIQAADKKVSENEIGIYFERDAADSFLSYRLFVTFKEWNEIAKYYNDPSFNDLKKSARYNQVSIVFDGGSADCLALSNHLAPGYQNADIKITQNIDDYINNGCRIVFTQLDKQFSGVGQIILSNLNGKENKLIEKFFFATNDIKRIKIDYYIKNCFDGIDIVLSSKIKGMVFDVNLLENKHRLPCLIGDKVSVFGDPIRIDFSNSNRQIVHVPLPEHKRNGFYSLCFKNEGDENLFLLNLLYEDSFDVITLGKSKSTSDEKFCPYCGSKLRNRKVVSAYDSGAVCCTSIDAKVIFPKILDRNGNRATKQVYCEKDLEIHSDQAVFNPKFTRLLPKDYYDTNTFKINILGSVRSGKTTFLSRFFGLSLTGNQVSMNLRYLTNAMSNFGISVTPAITPVLKVVSPGVYQIGDTNYISDVQFYKERAIDLANSCFPMATPSGVDCSRYPFIISATNSRNEAAYISFYDIPGEDARSKQFKNDAVPECSGIFLFINALKDAEGNAAIINSLKSANLPKDTPIAVILSKSDLVENAFLDNCHVKRVDYYDDKYSDYEKGIGREILASSMEVKSYLRAESMILDLENQYQNVMYFALSSFNFPESINQENQSFNEPGRLCFENSTKRIELPFLWMLKQFKMF